jgi:hypothetical protein
MLYGSVTMGSCYLIAALCLRAGQEDPSKSKTVCPFTFQAECLLTHVDGSGDHFYVLPLLLLLWNQLRQGKFIILLFLLICVLIPYQVPWVYNSEINSLGWRTRGAAAATATNWMGGFIVTQFTKIGVDTLKWRFYLSKLYLYDTEEMR